MSRTRVVQLASGLAMGLVALLALPSLDRLRWKDDELVVEVAREDFVRKVYAEGHLKAVEATPLNAPIDVPGPINIAWLAPDGSSVKKGDVVVRFDPTQMEKGLEDGKSDRDTAEHKIEKRGVEREGTLENLARDAELAELELAYAQEFQSKDAQIFSRTEIIESEIDQELATKRLDNAEDSRVTQDELARADLDLLAIERKKAELKINEAEQGLRSMELRAPHDGILVFKRDWRGEMPQVGQSVWGGYPIAEIPNLEEMEADVFVLEADAGGLDEDRPASVILEARPDEVFSAKIKKVDALAKRKIRWVPVQYFGVTLKLERTDPEIMKPGQRVRAILVLEELEDALVVPREAVFEVDGEKTVYRRSGWSFEPVKVTQGPSALGRVVIEEGLAEGDVIALRDPTSVEEETGTEEKESVSVPSPAGGSR